MNNGIVSVGENLSSEGNSHEENQHAAMGEEVSRCNTVKSSFCSVGWAGCELPGGAVPSHPSKHRFRPSNRPDPASGKVSSMEGPYSSKPLSIFKEILQ